MKDNRVSIGIGLLLVIAGALFLLQNFGVLGSFDQLLWVVLFGGGGLAFVGVFLGDREQWWAIIPGFTLLGLAGLIAFGDRLGALGATLFLGAIGLSFWVIYAIRREYWWAIIPGGALVTLALVAGLAEAVPGLAVGGIFFLGLSATFILVALLPSADEDRRWAFIPGGILGIMGLLLTFAAVEWLGILWPAVLIVGGGILVVRTMLACAK